MKNPEKLATQGTQEEYKQNKTKTQHKNMSDIKLALLIMAT